MRYIAVIELDDDDTAGLGAASIAGELADALGKVENASITSLYVEEDRTEQG